MEALNLFNQNFAVAESLLQLFQVFHGLHRSDLNDELRLAICTAWGDPPGALVHHARNDRLMVMARAAAPIPDSLMTGRGLDFLLRQAVVVGCTSLEAFFWDALRENVLTVVRARRSRADETLRNLSLTLGDYISIQQYQDPDLRLKQIILKNFERGTLYKVESIEKLTKVLTITNFWDRIEKTCGEKATTLRRLIGELINRRNEIAHRADRPAEGDEADELGLRPITYAWTNMRIQAARTLVSASAELIGAAIERLEADIRAAEEQAEALKVARREAPDQGAN